MREVQPWQVLMQPHGSSYFLPGKIAGKPVNFLLDSGCTTNFLSRQFFDTLSAKVRRGLEPYEGDHGTLSNGSCILFYDIIELTGRVRDRTIQETFIARKLNEDAILGMPFLQRHGCRIDFSKYAMLMGDRELTCVNKFGRPLVGGVQVVRSCTIPGHSRVTIHCKVDGGYISRLRIVESTHARIQLARSLNRLTGQGKIWVQCINPFSEAVNLPSGSILGCFHSVQKETSRPSWGATTESPRQHLSQGRRTAPYHSGTRGGYWDGCVDKGEHQGMAKLLHKYNDAPYQGDHDGSLNRAVCHEVPLVAETAPTRPTTRRKGRGSPQSKLDKQDPLENEYDWNQSQLQQRAGMPPVVVHNLRAKPVWTGNIRELRHLQGNLLGVVANVYRTKQEGRRTSDKQQRQGCTELQLYCQRWNSLRIGPDGLLTMSLATNHGQPAKERVVCPTAIRQELIWDTHQQTHAGFQRVLTKLQLRWYWPNMERDVRCRARQCETCQANKHGRSPGEAGWRTQYAEGPWQAEAVDLVEIMPMTPQEDVARQERPLPSLKVRPPPPAPRLPPPLPGLDTDLEVQKPPAGGAPYGDTRGTTNVTNRLEVSLVRRNHPRVSTPPPTVTTPPGQYTRQPPAYRNDLVRDRAICGKYKNPIRYHTGDGQRNMGVVNTTKISTFASAESRMRFIRRKRKFLVTFHNYAVHSFLMLMQSKVDVLRNNNHYHSHVLLFRIEE